MPAFEIRERLIPYRILSYLLYAPLSGPTGIEWAEQASADSVRITTGDAARALRMKNSALWEALFWLEENKLIKKVKKEQKRGTCVIILKQPINIKIGGSK